MARWTSRQFNRLNEPARPVQHRLDLPEEPRPHSNPWERALAAAREQLRDLIAQGDLAYDQITEGWIAEWAADLLDVA